MRLHLGNLWPFRKYAIATSLAPNAAAQAIEALVGSRPAWGERTTKQFSGERIGNQFKFVRLIAYRNSFLPIVRLSIEPAPYGSIVAVSMRMHALVIAFSAFWMFGATLGGLVASICAFTQGEPVLLIVWGMPAFGMALGGWGFGFEARRADELLRAALPSAEASALDAPCSPTPDP